MCPMMQKKGTVTRDKETGYISLIINPQANYKTVVYKAAQLLHLNAEKVFFTMVDPRF